MILRVLRWFGSNLPTILLAFILSLVVWVSSVTADNPNQELEYPRPFPIEIVGLDPNLIVVNELPETMRVTFNAPRTIQERLWADDSLVHAQIALTGLGAGEHTVPIEVTADARPVRVSAIDPAEVHVVLELLVTQTFTITMQVNGEPAFGYEPGLLEYQPQNVVVTGPESLVRNVNEVRGSISIANSTQDVSARVRLQAVDASGDPIEGVELAPETISVQQDIALQGSYRNLIVRVITDGQLANGYRLTNISPTPPTVIVFSSNPELLDEIPGYVETEPVSIEGGEDDFETFVGLNLPEGVTVVGNPRVLVQVSIAAIESSVRLTVPIQVIGVRPGAVARVAPEAVDVILSGPVSFIQSLKPEDIQIAADVTGYGLGVFEVSLGEPLLPERLTLESTLPETVEVTIETAPTPTPAVTPTANPG